MREFTEDEIWDRYEKLPEDLQEAVFSPHNADLNRSLADKYDFSDEVSKFATLEGRVLLGLIPPDQFKDKIENELNLEPETAKQVSQETQKLIFDPVRESLDKIYSEDPQTFETTTQLSDKPNSEESKGHEYLNKAKSYFFSEDNEEYMQEIMTNINTALELGLSRLEKAKAFVMRGSIYRYQGDLKQAEKDIEGALKRAEKFDEPSFHLGMYETLSYIYEDRGNIEGAVESLEKCISELKTIYNQGEVKGVLAEAHTLLGELFLEHNSQLEDAEEKCLENLEQAKEKDPDYPQICGDLGDLYATTEKYYDPQEAIKYYRKFLSQVPSEDPRRKNVEKNILALREDNRRNEEPSSNRKLGNTTRPIISALFAIILGLGFSVPVFLDPTITTGGMIITSLMIVYVMWGSFYGFICLQSWSNIGPGWLLTNREKTEQWYETKDIFGNRVYRKGESPEAFFTKTLLRLIGFILKIFFIWGASAAIGMLGGGFYMLWKDLRDQ